MTIEIQGDRMGTGRVVTAVCCGITAFAAHGAEADGRLAQCQKFQGNVVSPLDFDQAASYYRAVSPKGEFETTAAYEARKAASLQTTPSVLIVGKEVEDPEYLEYDADAEVLHVSSFAFDNKNFGVRNAFYAAGLNGKIPVSSMPSGNIDVVISTVDEPLDTYEASNSYGAKAQILRVKRTTKAIFERESAAGRRFEDLFPRVGDSRLLGTLRMPPEEAMKLKPNLKLAFVITPKEPFLVESNYRGGEPTVRNPLDVTEHFSVLVADFQCGLLLDGNNLVLAAYPTSAAADQAPSPTIRRHR